MSAAAGSVAAAAVPSLWLVARGVTPRIEMLLIRFTVLQYLRLAVALRWHSQPKRKRRELARCVSL